MDYLKNLSTIEEIETALENVEKDEKLLRRFILFNLTGDQEYYDISENADSVKASGVEYCRVAEEFRTMGVALGDMMNDVSVVKEELESCSSDAIKASEDIKHFNTLKVNGEKAYELVTALIDLNKSVAGIEHSLENEEYEKATEYIIKYRKAILTGDINSRDETIMEKSTETLLKALDDQLAKSILNNKRVQVFRYCSLLDSLGEGGRVIERLVEYILTPLKEANNRDYNLLISQADNHNIGVVTGNMLSGTYKKGVDTVEESMEEVKSAFVNEKFCLNYLIRCVYVECDTQCCRILNFFCKIRDMSQVCASVNTFIHQYVSSQNGVESKEMNEVNQILNEISLLLQHTESFDRYFKGKSSDVYMNAMSREANKDLEKYPSKSILAAGVKLALEGIQNKKLLPSSTECKSHDILKHMCNSYEKLEDNYTVYCIHRSLFNVQCDAESCCTSVPEETFYLFDIVIHRAVSQGNIHNLISVMSIIKHCIGDYLDYHMRTVARGKRILPTTNIKSELSKEQLSLVFITNDIYICLEYIKKLYTRTNASVAEVFPLIPTNLRKSIDDLNNSAVSWFKESYRTVMTKYKDTVLTPLSQKIEKRILTSGFTGRNDIQSDQQGEETLSSISALIHSTMHLYSEYLLEDINTSLYNDLSQALSSRLEISLVKQRYSQQGVMQLDHIVRGICNEFINNGGSEVRSNFSKVNRIIAVLSCDDVSTAMSLILNDKDDFGKDQVTAILKLKTEGRS